MQVVTEVDTAVHVQEHVGEPTKRAFTIEELEALFDHADQQVTAIRSQGRKGWPPAGANASSPGARCGKMPGWVTYWPDARLSSFCAGACAPGTCPA